MKQNKTNAARLLDQRNIPYQLRDYPVDELELGAEHAAQALGEDPWRLFKTIVLKGDKGGYFVCVVPAPCEIDLKKAARISGNKKCEPVHLRELLGLTGYIRGGCSPIGMKKLFPTYIHKSALRFNTILCSAGQRGLMFQIAPQDLMLAASATAADLIIDCEHMGV
ncbi:MAG: Cys-tRNA(Pro) deacylase [Bacteroidales bacterium]|nr:Cys-tRNA(Pro) deacylase [Bacteroidales bacterium]